MTFLRAFLPAILMTHVAIALEPQDPALGKYPLDPKYYQTLVDLGFLPTKPHLSDLELAERLNLDLPQLAGMKAAVAKKDQHALEQALGAYLNSKLPPTRPQNSPLPEPHATLAPQWLRNEIIFGGTNYPVSGKSDTSTVTLGDDIDWYQGSENCSVEINQWGVIREVGYVYAVSGDPRYAEAMIHFVRSFYRTAARPPVQRPKSYMGCYGPWRSLNASGRIMGGYMPATYRDIGGASCVTDADRVMFLKMFWEHADYCHVLLDEHLAHNFELHVVRGLMDLALLFPEFRDSKKWLDRCALRVGENMRDCLLDDGIAYERTGYHFPYWHSYLDSYRRLTANGATIPEFYAKGLERMSEATMHLMTPQLQFPLFGLGDMAKWDTLTQWAVEIFTNHVGFAYVASKGKEGKPFPNLSRVFPYGGWLTMRSDWTTNALYLAFNFNGNPRTQAGHYDQASFGLWAFGRPWMTNPGTCEDYSVPDYKTYVGTTIGANTVIVDDVGQDRWDNSGRLKTWEDLPGFTYLDADNDSYRGLGGTHNRKILFLRSDPGYWLIVDRIAGDGKPHDYRWLGHFQPTQLTIDPETKAIATAPRDGKRLWVIPVHPDTFSVEQGSGPLNTPDPTGAQPPFGPNRAIGPYVALRQKAVIGPASYAVLLYPAADGDAPQVDSLPDGGLRVRHGADEDLIWFGDELTFVRRHAGKLTEAGLVGSRRLFGVPTFPPQADRPVAEVGSEVERSEIPTKVGTPNAGKTLIEVDPEITGVHVRFTGNRPEVTARGRGRVKVKGNSKPIQVRVGRSGKIVLKDIRFSTEPASRCKGIGVPLGYGGTFKGYPGSSLVSIKSSLPSDMTIEWRLKGGTEWLRVVNPETITDHYYLLTDLTDGKTYDLRLTCRSADGRIGRSETTYTFKETP